MAKTTSRDSWISAETERKESDFRGILGMHVNICKGIMRRRPGHPYLYADLYAGPGHLEYKGKQFPGSPLIAQDLLVRANIPYEAVHFEQDGEVAERLQSALYSEPGALFGGPDATNSPVYNESFESGFPRWLRGNGAQARRLGLVYADPIKDEIPHALFNQCARLLPQVDLLSYVSATQYKRRRGSELRLKGETDKPLFSDHVSAVNKRIALIREPGGPWQWTFVLWSNWVDMPEWQSHGFYRLNSSKGQRILDRLDLTDAQQREKAQDPLFPASGAGDAA
ncbi:hypothetical protein [Streptacidiphilus carbonis]|uniref:hypothetical protein n=1 Tax=Streptacidiphilus carbonis TaxID=105422 RepID=UPI0005A7EEBF|nr:hypothetical protein [Streptacidiphilus carbonis]